MGAGQSTGLNPFENEPKKCFSVARLGIMLCVAVIGCFMAYQFFKVEVPQQNQQPITQKDVEKQFREMMVQQPNPISSPLSGMDSASQSYRRDRDQRDLMKQTFDNYSRQAGQQYQR